MLGCFLQIEAGKFLLARVFLILLGWGRFDAFFGQKALVDLVEVIFSQLPVQAVAECIDGLDAGVVERPANRGDRVQGHFVGAYSGFQGVLAKHVSATVIPKEVEFLGLYIVAAVRASVDVTVAALGLEILYEEADVGAVASNVASPSENGANWGAIPLANRQ